MTLLEVSERRKLAVWRTVWSCYATVLQNLGQLVRIGWLWLLIMVPVYAAAHWLVSNFWALPGIPPMPRWVGVIVVELPHVVELPFLASIAVAWHRLVLRQERVTTPAYLRLDRAVWLYALCALVFLALAIGPLLSVAIMLWQPLVDSEPVVLLSISLALVALALAIGLLILPRLSLVLPAVALGERLSPWQAWRITRGNTLRLGLATCLCMLPALLLILALPLLSLFLSMRSLNWTDAQAWTTPTPPNLIDRILDSIAYAVLNSLAYALLAIVAVTLLSVAYRFFVARREDSELPRP